MNKICTQGFREQKTPGECPECGCDMFIGTKDYVIGWGSYPLGGHRANLKPGYLLCKAYECPSCFTKSVHHFKKKENVDLKSLQLESTCKKHD